MSKKVEPRSRRSFLISIAESAAIATVAPFVWPVPVQVGAQPKQPDSLNNYERLIRLRAIIDEAMRSRNRAQMLIEAAALRLPRSNMLALESITIDHLRVLSNTQHRL